MSTLAGLRNQRTQALDDNQSQLIATYEDRLQAIKDAEDARAYQTAEREAQQEWQSGENALNREQSQRQFDIQQAFSEKQWEAQQSQWRDEFDYNKKSDAQKLAYNYVVSIVGNGGTPSDSLLAQAGLSRADANAMKKKKSSGVYPKKQNPKEETPGQTPGQVTDSSFLDGMGGNRMTLPLPTGYAGIFFNNTSLTKNMHE